MTTTILGGRAGEGRPEASGEERRPEADRRGGLSIGKVRGIEIRLDWSLIFIFVLIAMNLALGLFPQQHPQWSPALSWTVALLAAALFFASVLAHELAHALVARRYGGKVDRITLFIFGGLARMRDEPRSPGADLAIAIVGPITSFVIGVLAILLGAAVLGRAVGADGTMMWLRPASPAATLLLWLGPINVFLALFNSVPAFPLDGGRVLRAILWKATGDIDRATLWASGVGRAFAMLLTFAGVLMLFGHAVPFLGVGFGPGLWTILIGWFLYAAAVGSYQQLALRRTVEGVPVARLMRRAAPAVPANAPIDQVIDRFMQSPGDRCQMVADDGKLAGLVCMSDLAKVPRSDWSTRTVGEIMTPLSSLALATPSEDMSEALSKLATGDVDQLPVIEQGEVRGVLRRADIIRWMELQGSARPA
jgi:Zn-dependent protease/predicted transcriptional regulator